MNNINSSILLLDKEMRLKAFNDAMKTIFSSKKDEDLMYMKCGEAIGYAYQLEEQKECGKTSQCCNYDIWIAALNSYMNNSVVYKDHIQRPFFLHSGEKVMKYLQFSTRLFVYNNEKFIIMIVEDITHLKNLERAVA